MTNYEHFKKDIDSCIICVEPWGLVDGKIVFCVCTDCNECLFDNQENECSYRKVTWLNSEYEEPKTDWSKVPADTKILVSQDGHNLERRYFCKFQDGNVYAWNNGVTSWSIKEYEHYRPWRLAKLAEE